MMTFICVVSIALSLVQIPALALLFRRAHRLSRGRGGAIGTCSGCCCGLGRWNPPLTDAREEQEKLRDRLEESFDVVAAKLDMLTPEEEEMAAFSQGLENILGYTPERPDGRKHETGDGKAGVGPVLPGGGL